MNKIKTKDFLSGSLAHDKMYNELYKWNDDKGQVEKKTGVSGDWRPIKFSLNHFIKHIMPKCVKYEDNEPLEIKVKFYVVEEKGKASGFTTLVKALNYAAPKGLTVEEIEVDVNEHRDKRDVTKIKADGTMSDTEKSILKFVEYVEREGYTYGGLIEDDNSSLKVDLPLAATLYVVYFRHPESATGDSSEVFSSYKQAKDFVKDMVKGGFHYCIKPVEITWHEMQINAKELK